MYTYKRNNHKDLLHRLLPRVLMFLFAVAPTVGYAQEATDTTEIWGHIIYNADWNGVSQPAIVKFNTTPTTTYTNLLKTTGFGLYKSSTFGEDVINLPEVYNLYSRDDSWRCNVYEYSTKTWKEITHVNRFNSQNTRSTCSAYDPETRLTYGQFYTDDGKKIEFGTVDFEQLKDTGCRTTIRPVATDGTDTVFVALAFDDAGQLYGVTQGGSVLKVNKTTGYGPAIASVGFSPTLNLQSMAYDKKNKRFLWNGVKKVQVADSTQTLSSLYSIDPTAGTVVKLFDMPGNAEFASLHVPYIANEQAPDTVTGLKSEFTGSNTTGTVSFTLPTKAANGTSLTSQLHWTLKDGVKAVAEGDATAGSTVSKTISTTTGYHSFYVSASNNAGEGKSVYTPNTWIGYDIPSPVTAVKLTTKQSAGTATLTWTKPTTGIHGGYIGETKYNIVRNPDNVAVSTAQSEATFTETLPHEVLSAYSYSITAISENNQSSEAVTSNRAWSGRYWEVPVKETFDDAASIDPWLIVNDNNDAYSWSWESFVPDYRNSTAACFTGSSRGNDDWLISPFIMMKTDRKYLISFEVEIAQPSNNDVNYTHVFKPCFGRWRATGLTALDSVTISRNNKPKRRLKYVVAPTTENTYTFAIEDVTPKATTSIGDLYFDNFKVETYAKYTAPDSVRNLVITPAERGGLAATISFVTPTKTMGGDPLTSLTGAYVMRDDTILVKHFETASPGQQLTAEDTAVPNDGFHTYTVYAVNSEGDGVKFDSIVYVGIDVPKQPRPLKLINYGDGTGAFLWEEPSEVGANGGYVSQSDLTYNLYSFTTGYPQIMRKGLTSNNASVPIPNTGDQKAYYYLVSAVSRAGEGKLVISPAALSGAPYETPFKESFADCRPSTSPWLMDAYNNNGFNTLSTTVSDNDNGALYFTNVSGGEGKCTLYSPMISLDNCVKPSIKLSYYARPKRNIKFYYGIQKPDQDIVYFDTIDFNQLKGSIGWREVRASLSAFKDLKYIRVVVYVENKLVGTPFVIDNIRVENEFDKNLVLSLHTPAITRKGKTIKCTAKVTNNGNTAISEYDVIVRADDVEFDRQHVITPLAPDSVATYKFDYKVLPTSADTVKFNAEIVSSNDDYAADDTASRVTIVKPSELIPTTITGKNTDGTVEISWQAPANTNASMLEDFESVEPFTLTDFSPWKIVDGDKQSTIGPGYFSFPGMYSPMAFICLDNSQIAKIDNYPQYSARSGNQYLADFAVENYSRANDDWLISPELSGEAQTIRMYCKTPEENSNPEQFEFRWSTTDDKIESMTHRYNDTCYNAIYEWGYLDVPVPAGTKYFAIHVNTSARGHFMFMLDDISYTRGGLKLVAYNIYMDGQQIGVVNPKDFAGSNYSFTYNETTPHKYNVSVVYDDGESPLSNTYTTEPTGISTVAASDWTVSVRGSQVYINGADGQQILVTDTGGATYYRGTADGQVRLNVPAGIYIVRIGNITRKVVVR